MYGYGLYTEKKGLMLIKLLKQQNYQLCYKNEKGALSTDAPFHE